MPAQDGNNTKQPFQAAYKDEEGRLYIEVGETRFTYLKLIEAIRVSNKAGSLDIPIKDNFLTLVGELSLLWKAVKGSK